MKVIKGGESKDPALHLCFTAEPTQKALSLPLLPGSRFILHAWMVGGTGGQNKKIMTDPGVCGGKGMVVMMTEKNTTK